jgi:hypothetical protein
MGAGGKKPVQTSDLFDDDEDGDEDDGLFEDMDGQQEEEFPTFFGPELAGALRTARKSLVLLRAAMPDHPLLSGAAALQREVLWLWNEEDIEAAWAGTGRPVTREDEDNTQWNAESPSNFALKTYEPELAAQFGVFDLEPGTSSSIFASVSFPGNNVPMSTSLSTPIQLFMSRFLKSSTLPALTPTLAHLKALTFAPLVSHASELSRALLGLFLFNSPSASHQISNLNLNFSEHLVLLRSYLLLTSNTFKSRLAAALFSDSGEYDVQSAEVNIHAPARQIKSNNNNTVETDKQWAVGLAPTLTDRESWPPGGADLSFLLRTVIVDSLDEGRLDGFDVDEGEGGDMRGADASGRGAVAEEAEWRLGFAIRDLPVGAGRDRWLNPTCKVFPLYPSKG